MTRSSTVLRHLRGDLGALALAILLAPLFVTSLQAQVDPVPERKAPRYDSRGKRDPFINLKSLRKPVERAVNLAPPPLTQRPPGLPGLLVDEVTLVGVVTGADSPIALLKGIDGMTYFAVPGDRVFDGEVEAIRQDTVQFIRKVRDTRGRTHRSRVTKRLYSQEVREDRLDEKGNSNESP